MFQDEEFEKALSELNEPSLEEYEFFTECMDVKIYRKYSELTGLYEYKVSGYLDCNTELCQQVYMDLEYRKKWDSYVKAFMHYFDNPGGSIPTWLINWAAKNGVPAFLNDMKNACLGYENYIEEKA